MMTHALVSTILLLAAPAPADSRADSVIQEFLEHVVRSDVYAPAAKAFVADAWKRRQEEPRGKPASFGSEDFLVEALAVLSPQFDRALAEFESGEMRRAEEAFRELTDTEDPYLAANARVFELRAAVENERIERALTVAETMVQQPDTLLKYTRRSPQVHYLLGYCYLRDLQYEQAAEALADFLVHHPEAPEPMLDMAVRLLQELDGRVPDGLGDVADLMSWAGAALGNGRADDPVLEKQHRALALLDKLIEDAEELERQCKAKNEEPGDGTGAAKGAPFTQDKPAMPADQSRLVGGQSQAARLRNVERAMPGETWGNMPPRERERILQPIRERFPGRYRGLVEQYYRELAGTE